MLNISIEATKINGRPKGRPSLTKHRSDRLLENPCKIYSYCNIKQLHSEVGEYKRKRIRDFYCRALGQEDV